jgi:hypothetical protein
MKSYDFLREKDSSYAFLRNTLIPTALGGYYLLYLLYMALGMRGQEQGPLSSI